MKDGNENSKGNKIETIDTLLRALDAISLSETMRVANKLVAMGKPVLYHIVSALNEHITHMANEANEITRKRDLHERLSYRLDGGRLVRDESRLSMPAANSADVFKWSLKDWEYPIKGLIFAISKIGGDEAIQSIGRALQVNNPYMMRFFGDDLSAAFRRLGQPGITYLISTLEYSGYPKGELAIDVLVRIGKPAVGHLVEALKHKQYCRGAAIALGRIDDARSTGPLLDLYRISVRSEFGEPAATEAEEALERLTSPYTSVTS